MLRTLFSTALLFAAARGAHHAEEEHASTTQDGAIDSAYITYLKTERSRNQGAILDLADLDKLSEESSFTLMMWIKPLTNLRLEGGANSVHHVFRIKNSIYCKILVSTNKLVCGNQKSEQPPLQISIDHLPAGKWAHLAFASDAKNYESYLRVMSNDMEEYEVDKASYAISFSQTSRAWKGCLSNCGEGNSFNGGFRDIVLLGVYVPQERTDFLKNYELGWNHNSLSYVRFTEANFLKDQIWGSQSELVGGEETTMKAYDLLPQDICPSTRMQKQFLEIGAKKQPTFQPIQFYSFNLFEIKKWPVNTYFSYSVSLKVMFTEHYCHVQDPSRAADVCHLLKLDNVFVLYKTSPTTARFHFFAEKAYNSKRTAKFDLPLNQWVTIQAAFSYRDGYSIKVFDSNGRERHSEEYGGGLNKQRGGEYLHILSHFRGLVDHVAIFKEAHSLPIQVPEEGFKESFGGLFSSFSFSKVEDMIRHYSEVSSIDDTRAGSHPRLVAHQRREPRYAIANYVKAELGGAGKGLIEDWNPSMFDGITCADEFNEAATFDSPNSFIEARTHALDFSDAEGNSSHAELTVEFWLKMNPEAWASLANRYVFSLRQMHQDKDLLAIKFNEEGKLVCQAHTQHSGLFTQEMVYTFFQQTFMDSTGWTHISCLFKSDRSLSGTISNRLYSKDYEILLEDDVLTLEDEIQNGHYQIRLGAPQHSQRASATGIQLKEVKVWKVLRKTSDIKDFRLKQFNVINDDYEPGTLLAYLPLSENSMTFSNLASFGYPAIPKFANDGMITMARGDLPKLGMDGQPIASVQHTVCPFGTTLNGDRCLNKKEIDMVVTILPEQPEPHGELYWKISIEHTPFQEQKTWDSQNTIFSLGDDKVNVMVGPNWIMIPQTEMRDEQSYALTISSSNQVYSQFKTDELEFVPLSCKYFVSELQMKNETKMMIEERPGKADLNLTFNLVFNQYGHASPPQDLEDDYPEIEAPDQPLPEEEELEEDLESDEAVDEEYPEDDYPEETVPEEETLKESESGLGEDSVVVEEEPVPEDPSSEELVVDEYDSLPAAPDGRRLQALTANMSSSALDTSTPIVPKVDSVNVTEPMLPTNDSTLNGTTNTTPSSNSTPAENPMVPGTGNDSASNATANNENSTTTASKENTSHCSSLQFFDQLANITYKFVLPNADMQLLRIPKVGFNFRDDSEGRISSVEAIIPQAEQGMLPVNQDIQLIVQFHWVNSKYSKYMNESKAVFQHAIYTFKFQPFEFMVVPSLLVYPAVALPFQVISFDGRDSYLLGTDLLLDTPELKFEWRCREPLKAWCDSKTAQNLWSFELDREQFDLHRGEYNVEYDVTLVVTWMSPDGFEFIGTQQKTFRYLNIEKPEFSVVADTIYATYPEAQTLELNFTNYTPQELSAFDIFWQIYPEIPGMSFSSDNMSASIPPNSLQMDQSYFLNVKASHKVYASVMSISSYFFQTGTAPFGGNVLINPEEGSAGQFFTASVSDWRSLIPGSNIMWRLWETEDESGVKRDLPINMKWMPASRSQLFVANSYNPYLFEIKDSSNERAIQTVRLNLEGGENSPVSIIARIENSTKPEEPSVNTANRLIATFEVNEQKQIRSTIISWVYRTISIELKETNEFKKQLTNQTANQIIHLAQSMAFGDEDYLSLESIDTVLAILEKVIDHTEGYLLRRMIKSSEESTQAIADLLSLVRRSLLHLEEGDPLGEEEQAQIKVFKARALECNQQLAQAFCVKNPVEQRKSMLASQDLTIYTRIVPLWWETALVQNVTRYDVRNRGVSQISINPEHALRLGKEMYGNSRDKQLCFASIAYKTETGHGPTLHSFQMAPVTILMTSESSSMFQHLTSIPLADLDSQATIKVSHQVRLEEKQLREFSPSQEELGKIKCVTKPDLEEACSTSIELLNETVSTESAFTNALEVECRCKILGNVHVHAEGLLPLIPWSLDVPTEVSADHEESSLAKASIGVILFFAFVLGFGLLGQLAAHLLYQKTLLQRVYTKAEGAEFADLQQIDPSRGPAEMELDQQASQSTPRLATSRPMLE